jgi:hypothetical protein
MVPLADLWLPILVSAVLVFIASSIIWMATPLHKHDYKDPGEKEEAITGMLRSAALAPGVYFVPWCKGREKDPAVQEKLKSGPWALLTVLPSGPNMGKLLGLWFVHLLIVGLFVAYLAGHAGIGPGAAYMSVFRAAGVAALLAHAGYAMPMSIWHGQPWSQLPLRLVDAVVYALVTAGSFAGFWPSAA